VRFFHQVLEGKDFAETTGAGLSAAQRVRLAAGGGLALGLLFFFFRGMDWAALAGALRSADPLALLGVALAAVVTYVARAWRWGLLLKPMARVGFLDLFSATTVGFMTGLLVPRAGEIVRPYLVARRYPVSTSAGFATIILERLFDLLTVLGLFAAYLFALPRPAAETSGPLMGLVAKGGIVVGLGSLVLLGVLVVFHAKGPEALAVADRVLRVLPAWLAQAGSGILRAFADGLAVLRAPLPELLAIAGQSILVWLSIALGLHLNHLAFGVALPFHATFLVIAFLTVGVAIPTPGMVGGFHGFFIWALADAFGVDRGVAGAAALTAHALSNLPVLVLGLLFLGREGLSLSRVAEISEKQPAGQAPAAGGVKP
jgi:uncharacterized protein (TIRG00374 family)